MLQHPKAGIGGFETIDLKKKLSILSVFLIVNLALSKKILLQTDSGISAENPCLLTGDLCLCESKESDILSLEVNGQSGLGLELFDESALSSKIQQTDSDSSANLNLDSRHVLRLLTTCCQPGILRLHLRGSGIRKLPGELFAQAPCHSLREVSLDATRLAAVGSRSIEGKGAAFLGLPNLVKLLLTRNRELKAYPTAGFAGLNASLQELWLTDNPVTALTANSLLGLGGALGSRLSLLNLSANRLSSLEAGCFMGLGKSGPSGRGLKRLILAKNRISELRPGMFQGLDQLEELDLSENPISAIIGGSFMSLSQLRRLFISGNSNDSIASSGIVRLTPAMMHGLKRLRELNLSYLRLEQIDPNALIELDNLQKLTLAGNQLSQVPMIALDRLSVTLRRPSRLVSLDLSNNQIKCLQPGRFEQLSRLRRLDLSGNLLTKLDADTFRGLVTLRRLNLANNPLRVLATETFRGLYGPVSAKKGQGFLLLQINTLLDQAEHQARYEFLTFSALGRLSNQTKIEGLESSLGLRFGAGLGTHLSRHSTPSTFESTSSISSISASIDYDALSAQLLSKLDDSNSLMKGIDEDLVGDMIDNEDEEESDSSDDDESDVKSKVAGESLFSPSYYAHDNKLICPTAGVPGVDFKWNRSVSRLTDRNQNVDNLDNNNKNKKTNEMIHNNVDGGKSGTDKKIESVTKHVTSQDTMNNQTDKLSAEMNGFFVKHAFFLSLAGPCVTLVATLLCVFVVYRIYRNRRHLKSPPNNGPDGFNKNVDVGRNCCLNGQSSRLQQSPAVVGALGSSTGTVPLLYETHNCLGLHHPTHLSHHHMRPHLINEIDFGLPSATNQNGAGGSTSPFLTTGQCLHQLMPSNPGSNSSCGSGLCDPSSKSPGYHSNELFTGKLGYSPNICTHSGPAGCMMSMGGVETCCQLTHHAHQTCMSSGGFYLAAAPDSALVTCNLANRHAGLIGAHNESLSEDFDVGPNGLRTPGMGYLHRTGCYQLKSISAEEESSRFLPLSTSSCIHVNYSAPISSNHSNQSSGKDDNAIFGSPGLMNTVKDGSQVLCLAPPPYPQHTRSQNKLMLNFGSAGSSSSASGTIISSSNHNNNQNINENNNCNQANESMKELSRKRVFDYFSEGCAVHQLPGQSLSLTGVENTKAMYADGIEETNCVVESNTFGVNAFDYQPNSNFKQFLHQPAISASAILHQTRTHPCTLSGSPSHLTNMCVANGLEPGRPVEVSPVLTTLGIF